MSEQNAEHIGKTLTALVCVNPDGSRTIFAQMNGPNSWYPFVFADRAAFDRTLAKARPSIDSFSKEMGIKFEICTFYVSGREPLESDAE